MRASLGYLKNSPRVRNDKDHFHLVDLNLLAITLCQLGSATVKLLDKGRKRKSHY
jgi:hypothetical protein